MRTLELGDLRGLVGTTLGTSAWHTITQETIDGFAALTGDDQWIHTDPVRAARTPMGSTVAHGFLTLSLAPVMAAEVATFTGVPTVINLGCDAVRFKAPVPAGAQIRGRIALRSVRRRGRRFTEAVLGVTYELEDGSIACTADLVILLSPEEAA